jgi:type IV secretion system protein VirD4
MNEAVMAWGAFKNMMRKAGRDPVWALVNLVTVPIREKPFTDHKFQLRAKV